MITPPTADLAIPTRLKMSSDICFVGLDNLPLLAPEFGHLGSGGAQLQQTLLAKALTRRGFRVSMVVSDLGQPDGAQWHGIQTFRAYRAAAGIPGVRFLHPRLSGIWSAMRRADAKIYYVSCAGMLIAIATAFAACHHRRTIFRVASDSDCNPEKLLVRLARDRQLYAWGLKRADRVLAQTPFQQHTLQKNYGVESRVARSLADLESSARPLPDRDIDVLWVSNIQPVKRPDRVLTLAAQLPGLRFHLIGGRMDAHAGLYDSIASKAAALDNVTFRGAVPYHEIRPFYGRARILANTSDVEGFPNTYLQAWANATPVVAFHDPNSAIAEYGLGRAVTDPDMMREAIDALAADDTLWCRASDASRKFVESKYADEPTLVEYLRAIGELTSNHDSRG